MNDNPNPPVLRDRDKPLKDPKVAERAVLNALRAMNRQAEALADADYTTIGTVRKLRRKLDMSEDEFAAKLGMDVADLVKFEGLMAPDSVAKTMAYTGKFVDEIYRLLSFSQGGPDSRQELSLGDLVKYLLPSEFEQFCKWVEEGKRRAEAVEIQ
jgi:DNA-binding transcriptional regulator YiaG